MTTTFIQMLQISVVQNA